MKNLPQSSVTATCTPIAEAGIRKAQPLADIGTAQHTALIRWFSNEPVGDTMDALHACPTYPLVPCNEQARAFAPGRGTPRPAA